MVKSTTQVEVTPVEFKVGTKGAKAAAMLRQASDLEKEARRLKENAKVILSDLLPREYGNDGTFRGQPVVTVARGTNTSADLKRLALEFPEAYAAVVRSTSYTYYRAL